MFIYLRVSTSEKGTFSRKKIQYPVKNWRFFASLRLTANYAANILFSDKCSVPMELFEI